MFFYFCFAALILITSVALWIHWTYSIWKKAEKDLILDNWLLLLLG